MATLANQLPTISEMDEVVGFSTLTETLDDAGGLIKSYSAPTADIRAKVRYERTNEGELGTDQQKFTQEIKVWIRYYSTATEYKFLYWRSKYYDIYAIETTPRSRFMVIKARLIEA